MEVRTMPRICMITKKRTVSGNNVSHAHNVSKRKFRPNLHTKRFWDEERKAWVKLRVSCKGIRIIDRIGIAAAVARYCRPKSGRGKV